MQPAEAEITRNERLVFDTFERFNAGRPLGDLVDTGYRATGDHWPIDRFDEGNVAAPRDPAVHGYRMQAREVSERAPGFVFVEALWRHEASTSRGSAGLVWSVVQVRSGRLRSTSYFATRAEAERRADAG